MLAHIKKALLFGSSHQTWTVELIRDNLLMVWKRDRGRTEGRWWKHLPGSVQGVAGSRAGWTMEQTAEQNVSSLLRSLASALGHHKSSELLPVCFICDWWFLLQWLASLLSVFEVLKFGFSWRHFSQTINPGILSSITSLKLLSRACYAELQGSLLKNWWSTQTKMFWR